MRIEDIVRRDKPRPWAEGDNIPWREPGFSTRMLAEHLNQEHDYASRRGPVIEGHVRWIHTELLGGRPTRLLDLCCGPGLYTARLARLGHECTGIDYSPAAIAYAQERCADEGWACRYLLGDVREAEYGSGYGLAMLIFGELNLFRPAEADAILARMYDALAPDGVLLLELHDLDAVRGIGEREATWSAHERDVFSPEPTLRLTESRWDPDSRTATVRYYVVDAASGEVALHAQTFQAYDEDGCWGLLERAGFVEAESHPALGGAADETGLGLFALTARRPRMGE
jgi:SAM-dependent methyltransferase